MDKLIKKRINFLFGFLCIFIPVQFFISFIVAVFLLMPEGVFTEHFKSFYLTFVIPQLLYPIICAMLFLIVTSILNFKITDLVKREKTKPIDYVAYTFFFLAVSSLCGIITDLIIGFLSDSGVDIITFESQIPEPENAFEIILLVFVIAVLPAICEEFIYRLSICGILSNHHVVAAIIVSSIGFSLSHALLEQIPYAFLLGIILGFMYMKTKNFRVTMIVHFVNNLLGVIAMILSVYLSKQAYETFITIFDISVLALGLLSAFFIFKSKERNIFIVEKKELSHKEFALLTIKSPLFWLYVVLFVSFTLFQQFASTMVS